MTGEVAARPAPPSSRSWLAALGAVVLVVAVCPPMATLARRTEVLDATQFAALAFAVPALVALGAPWRLAAALAAAARRLAAWRDRGGPLVGAVALAAQIGCVVAWRSAAAVGAIQSNPPLVLLEAASLLVVGLGLWTALVASPPLVPCVAPRRLVLATIAMWAVWIVAYVLGMAHGGGYPGFVHTAGVGLSAVADRQAATAVLFASAAAAYLPVIFTSLFAWLASEERRGDADTSRRLAAGGLGGVRREDVRPAR